MPKWNSGSTQCSQTPNTKTAHKITYFHTNEINSISSLATKKLTGLYILHLFDAIYKLSNVRKLNPCVAVGTQEASEPDTEILSM
jgi:hypothetical protein